MQSRWLLQESDTDGMYVKGGGGGGVYNISNVRDTALQCAINPWTNHLSHRMRIDNWMLNRDDRSCICLFIPTLKKK